MSSKLAQQANTIDGNDLLNIVAEQRDSLASQLAHSEARHMAKDRIIADLESRLAHALTMKPDAPKTD